MRLTKDNSHFTHITRPHPNLCMRLTKDNSHFTHEKPCGSNSPKIIHTSRTRHHVVQLRLSVWQLTEKKQVRKIERPMAGNVRRSLTLSRPDTSPIFSGAARPNLCMRLTKDKSHFTHEKPRGLNSLKIIHTSRHETH